MDWRAILAALTSAPARRMKDTARGALTVGAPADLVLVEGTLGSDVQALTRVRANLGGREICFSPRSSRTGQACRTAAEKLGVSLQTGSLLVGDVREEQSVDDLDRARLQDFYDELERFRAVFARRRRWSRR